MSKANRRSTSFSHGEINYLQQLFIKLLYRNDIEVLLKRPEFHNLYLKFTKMHDSCVVQTAAQMKKDRDRTPFGLAKS
jgi:hypothetical protein